MRRTRIAGSIVASALVVLASSFIADGAAFAASNCSFTTIGSTLNLNASCATDTTITIPNGMTLDGHGRSITAVDPPAGAFLGAVVQAVGGTANVRNVTVAVAPLAPLCQPDATAIRGVLFDGAKGSVVDTRVLNVSRGTCDEGNAIVIRNSPNVLVQGNRIVDFAKRGIVVTASTANLLFNDISTSLQRPSLQTGVTFNSNSTGSATLNRVKVGGDGETFGVFVLDSNDIKFVWNTFSGGSFGIYIDARCALGTSASRNNVVANTAEGSFEGIVVFSEDLAPADTCHPLADRNVVRGNVVRGSQDGIFVGSNNAATTNTEVAGNLVGAINAKANGITVFGFNGTSVVDRTSVVRNVILGFATGILRQFDTNTTVSANLISP